jgi:hypothetical protein
MRLYTDSSDANFPDGQMQNIQIKGNTFNRVKGGIYSLVNMGRNIRVCENIFNGKDFTEAGFTTGTTMDSLYVLGVDDSLSSGLVDFQFDNNTCWGFEYVLYDIGGLGSAGTFLTPRGCRGNSFRYFKYWDTAAFIAPTVQSMMHNNVGTFFLDRTGWTTNAALFNSIGDGASSNTELRSMMLLASSSDVRIYYDDVGGFKAL